MAQGEKWKKLLSHLKDFAPTLVGAVGTVAGSPVLGAALASVAQALVAGKADPEDLDEVAATILGTPELRVEMEKLALERERAHLALEAARIAAETERQKAVNETMRAEAGADDKWTRRWRPFWGFASGVAFAVQMLAAAYILFSGGDPQLLDALAGFAGLWAPAMAVLGITSWTRGQEKVTRARTATPQPGSISVS